MDLEKPEVGGGAITAPAPVPNAALTKELKKLQDRRDNWMFMRPEEILMDRKTSAFLEDKEKNSFMGFKPLEKEKNAQERYFEERDEKNQNNEDSGKDPRSEQQKRIRMELNRRELEKENNEDGNTSGIFGEKKKKDSDSFLGVDRKIDSPFTSRDELNGLKTPAFLERDFGGGLIQERGPSAFEKQELKQKAEQRDSDFMKMLQPRSLPGTSIPGLAGGLDPLNTQIDSTRIDANPTKPGSETITFGERPSFLANDAATSFRPDLPSAGVGDLLPRSAAAAAPSFGPSVNSPISQGSAGSVTRPFIFEMPRRAF